MDLIKLVFLSLISLLSFSYVLMKTLRLRPQKNKKRTVPMAQGAWPLIGHLAHFDYAKPIHYTFGDMADKYGPVFMTKLGTRSLMIINNHEVAKECYIVNDRCMDRPTLFASKLLGYNDSFLTFSPNGSYWREIRKITVSEIFSASVVDTFKYCRAREANVTFGDLYKRWEQKGGPKNGVLVDIKQELHDLAGNISLMSLAGKRYFGESPNCDMGEARRCRKLIRELIGHFEQFIFSDVSPALGWLDWKVKRDMKRTAKELDQLVEDWVEEHKNKDCSGGSEKDFLDLLMEIFKRDDKALGFDDVLTTLKALCLNMVTAGSESVTAMLVWAVSLLANNPDVLRKAQEELDRTIGKKRVVEESDTKGLVYLQAIVKESFRLYPSVPLVSQRFVMEDFDIVNGNYHIPAGTEVILNAWKIGNDPSLYSDPEKFEPERFLTSNKDIDFSGQSYKLIGFGLGRRSCPAIHLGLRIVHYVLARFLQSFDMARPSDLEVDMTQIVKLVNHRLVPLEVLVTPRLHQSLYHVDRTA